MENSPVRITVAAALAAAVSLVLLACGGDDAPPPAAAPNVAVLSSQPTYVSGGSALVSAEGTAASLHATLNGVDVSTAFKPDPTNSAKMLGLITGMSVGSNALVVDNGGVQTTVALQNWPSSGPILSGPHLYPYVCNTAQFFLPDGTFLGPQTDIDCSAPSRVMYVYKTTGGIFKSMPSTTSLPSDVATTTTTDGATVPYVVRFEAGTLDRGIYNIAILHDPTKEAAPSAYVAPKGWNKRLSYVHGAGCVGGWYYQGTTTGVQIPGLYDISQYISNGILGILPRPADLSLSFNVLADNWLSRGYAVVTNTLNNPSVSCNPHLAGEAAMMTKESFVKSYGVPFFTISTGGSGGAYTSLQIADAFPGVFDGVSISASFPDALSLGMAGLHANLMFHYWSDLSPGTLTDAQKVAITGYFGVTAALDAANQAARTDPTPGRVVSWSSGYTSGQWTVLAGYPLQQVVPANLRWDPLTNPTGARADVFDVGRNVYGVNPATGFALRPFDNTGVQYGLAALNSGAITPDQFLDLNAKVGGVDNNGNFVASRSVADVSALSRAYKAGVNLGGNGGLASIPIFDNAQKTESGGYHYGWYDFAIRDRLRAANGNSDNMVLWRGQVPAATVQSLFEQWMVAYKSDNSSDSQVTKVLRAKPTSAVEGCWSASTPSQFTAEALVFSSKPVTPCATQWPVYSNTLKEAGGPLAANTLKCQLKAVDPADYKVAMTAAQLASVAAIFPTGVCDWSKGGAAQAGVSPYGSLGPSSVNPIVAAAQ